jgi:hypothetical protein
MNFLPEKKCGVPSRKSVKKNVLCEIGDEITRFDGMYQSIPFLYSQNGTVSKRFIIMPIQFLEPV